MGVESRRRPINSVQIVGCSNAVMGQAHNLKVAGSNPAPATIFCPTVDTANQYQVYVLRNPQGRFYIGLTESVFVRLKQYNSAMSRWTHSRRPRVECSGTFV